MTITQRGIDWSRCPRCGGSNLYVVNEYGVHQCRDCRYCPEREWEPRGEHHSRKRISTCSQSLEGAAEFYGYEGSRRFYDQVRRGRVLGIGHEPGRIILHSKPDEVKGPLADRAQEVLLLPGTVAVNVEVCSGSAISGRIYVLEVRSKLQHPYAVMQSEAGFSGPIVQVTCWPRP